MKYDHSAHENEEMVRYFAQDEESIERTRARIYSTRGYQIALNVPKDAVLTRAYYLQCKTLEARGLVRCLPLGDNAVLFIPRPWPASEGSAAGYGFGEWAPREQT